jgi:hypothetical protein
MKQQIQVANIQNRWCISPDGSSFDSYRGCHLIARKSLLWDMAHCAGKGVIQGETSIKKEFFSLDQFLRK